MNRLIYLSIFILSLASCTETGRDVRLDQQAEQLESTEEVRQKLTEIFDLAWTNPQKAEVEYAYIISAFKGTTPVVDDSPELTAATYYVTQALRLSRDMAKIKKDMSIQDYTQIGIADYIASDIEREIPQSDISVLIFYIRLLNKLSEDLPKTWDGKSNRNPEAEKRITDEIHKMIKEVKDKMMSYPEIAGKESDLINTTWKAPHFDIDAQKIRRKEFPYVENGLSEYSIRFKDDHQCVCDSILIPLFKTGRYYHKNGGKKTHREILERAVGDNEGGLFRSGKEFRAEGEYYFGTQYLTILFHLMDEYDMIFTIKYDADEYQKSEGTRIFPLRREPASHTPLGRTYTYMSVIDDHQNLGTVPVGDDDFWELKNRGTNLNPMAWIKTSPASK